MRAESIGLMTTTVADISITSLAKEIGNALIVGNNRTCSNRGSGKNRGGNGMCYNRYLKNAT